MKLIVLGGNGYIGSVLVSIALKERHDIKVIDYEMFGKNVPEGIEYLKKNIIDTTVEDFRGYDACVFLAGFSNDPCAEFSPEANYVSNVKCLEHAADMCKEAGVKRMTFASSASVYDIEGNWDLTPRNEETYVSPIRPYSITKYIGENILLAKADKNFHVAIVRQGTVYGLSPRMRYDLVVNTMTKYAHTTGTIFLHNGGNQGRPLVSVTDTARVHLHLLRLPDRQFNEQRYNLTGENIQVRDVGFFVKAVYRDVEIENQQIDMPVRNYYMDDRKLKATGFGYTGSIVQEIAKIKDAMPENPDDDIYFNIRTMKNQQK